MRGACGDRWVVAAADLLRAPHRRDALVDGEERRRLDRLDGPPGCHGEGEGGGLLLTREVGEQDEVVVTECIEAAGDAATAELREALTRAVERAARAEGRAEAMLAAMSDLRQALEA